MDKLNLHFVFLDFAGLLHSQCCIKYGSPIGGKISLANRVPARGFITSSYLLRVNTGIDLC